MAWVVDTFVLLDIRLGDPRFAKPAVSCLNSVRSERLLISPITFIELGPAFAGHPANQRAFLTAWDVECDKTWTAQHTVEAYSLWSSYTARRRQHLVARRPVADALIAAFASRWHGLITRNAQDFGKFAPSLRILDPTAFP